MIDKRKAVCAKCDCVYTFRRKKELEAFLIGCKSNCPSCGYSFNLRAPAPRTFPIEQSVTSQVSKNVQACPDKAREALKPMNVWEIRSYIDGCVNRWRDIKADENHELNSVALYYVDAYQSARASIFGKLLPQVDNKCPLCLAVATLEELCE